MPPLTRDRTNYNLRSGMNITTPQIRTTTYQKSFFPNSIKDWNELDMSARGCPSIDSFKEYQKKNCGFKVNSLFNKYSTKESINQSRIRLGLSGLSSQRHDYNHIDSPKCLSYPVMQHVRTQPTISYYVQLMKNHELTS